MAAAPFIIQVGVGEGGMWDQRPLGCPFLLPLWHPVLMAEQIGTLAAMAAAPFIIQVGVGEGEVLFASMGKDLRERGARTERGIRLVKALLNGETVDDEEWDIKGAHIAPLRRTPPGRRPRSLRPRPAGAPWHAGHICADYRPSTLAVTDPRR